MTLLAGTPAGDRADQRLQPRQLRQVCKGLLEEFPGIVTYGCLSRNFGEHNAVMAGLNQTRGEYVVIMDDDFQNPPEEVPRLLQEIEKAMMWCTAGTRKKATISSAISAVT